ncbi:MAG: polyprenyl diphosphate synthase [Thermomicrobiales bacterium]
MQERHPAAYTDNRDQPLPRHVAIMTDGNGRWGQRHGWPRRRGHQVGADNVRSVIFAAIDLGIEYLTLFVFSTENWRRPAAEVESMLGIVYERIIPETDLLHHAGIRIKHIGDLNDPRVAPEFADAVRWSVERTRNNTRMTLTLAINYGGRGDLVQAIRQILRNSLDPGSIDDATVRRYLYTADIPDPDLIIRPSGEQRLSNFLLWQGVNADFSVMDILWPDFRPEHLRIAVGEYQQRRYRERGGEDILDRAGVDPADSTGTTGIAWTPHPAQEPALPEAPEP